MEDPCVIIMVCADPESGTDHSLKEVSACLIWHKVNTAMGQLLSTLRCYIFFIYN